MRRWISRGRAPSTVASACAPCGGFGLGIEHHEAHAVDGYDVDEAPVYRCVNLEACVDARRRSNQPAPVHRQTAFWATPP